MVLSRRTIITSRNVVWLNKSYGDFMKVPESDRSLFIDPSPPEYNSTNDAIDNDSSDDDNDDDHAPKRP